MEIFLNGKCKLSLLLPVPFLSLHRTYEMELRLSDPKKKDDDMGVILVDVCLMFRDATIKKGPVRQFLISAVCRYRFLFLLLYLFL